MMKFKPTALVLLFSVSLSAQAAFDIDTEGLHVAAPPAPGSPVDRKDTETLLRYQRTRTDEQCEAANLQSFPSVKAFFGPATGVLTAREVARVEEFGTEVLDTVDKAVAPFKKRYRRDRPYDENSEIEPCIRRPGGHMAYPSSHAAMGFVLGDVLAEIYPDKHDALLQQGLAIGENRVLGGVHHPTDIIAGQWLGRQIDDALRQNAEFRRELRALKQ